MVVLVNLTNMPLAPYSQIPTFHSFVCRVVLYIVLSRIIELAHIITRLSHVQSQSHHAHQSVPLGHARLGVSHYPAAGSMYPLCALFIFSPTTLTLLHCHLLSLSHIWPVLSSLSHCFMWSASLCSYLHSLTVHCLVCPYQNHLTGSLFPQRVELRLWQVCSSA